MHYLGRFNLAGLQILAVLQGIVTGWVLVVRWAMGLLERGVLVAHALLRVDGVVEVDVGEDTVVGHAVVGRRGLKVVQVRETGSVSVAEPEHHVLIAVIDGVGLLALEEAEHVVLHDGVLLNGASVGTSGLAADAVTDGEDILVSVVLKGVAVDVNLAILVTDA